MKRVLVTGSTGMLGKDLIRIFNADTNYDVFGLSRGASNDLPNSKQFHIDLALPFSLDSITTEPDIIIHTAALTDLGLCEQKPQLAEQVHVEASRILAGKLSKSGKFIYISTDSVFDGIRGNYSERDSPNPLNTYAFTKLKGELGVKDENKGATTIVRTNIYGFHIPLKASLAEWAYKEWKDGKKISGFSDTIFNAVHTQQLATIVKFMVDNEVDYPVVNIGSDEAVSKYDFLEKFRVALGVSEDLLKVALSTDYPSAIQRPLNTSLDTTLLSTFYKVPSFENGIRQWISGITNL